MKPHEFSALFTEGTAVTLTLGGQMMTIEKIRHDGIVATVWFDGAECRRDAFHPDALTIWLKKWPES